jgi:hypothetical protein
MATDTEVGETDNEVGETDTGVGEATDDDTGNADTGGDTAIGTEIGETDNATDKGSDTGDVVDTSPPETIDIFDDGEVREYHLTFDQSDWAEQLRENALNDQQYSAEEDVHTYLRADGFSLGDTVGHDVGVRYRGRSSNNWDYPANSLKPSIRIKLNKYVPGQKFFGYKKLNFRNNNYDPSWLKEKLVFDILSEYTVSVRTAHAKLFINGEDFGLYLLIENIDGDYLENHFGEGEHGDLFKCEEFGIEMMATDPLQNYIRKTNEGDVTAPGETYDYRNDPKQNLVAALEVLNTSDVTRTALEEAFDIDAFTRFLAINNFFVNFDSYMGRGHNYYLYQRDSDGRFIHLAWDMNTTFAGMVNPGIVLAWDPLDRIFAWYEDGTTQIVDTLSPYWSVEAEIDGIPIGPYMPYSQHILEIPELLGAYQTFYSRFLREEFVEGRWDDRIDTLAARIVPYVEADTHALYPIDVSLEAMEDFLAGGFDAIGEGGPDREGIRRWGNTRHQFLITNYPELTAD